MKKLKKYKFRNPNHKVNGVHNCLSHTGEDDLFYYDGYKLDLEDGVYEVNITSTSFQRIEDIPKQKNVYSYRDTKYPQFTNQHLKGKLSVKNKTIDLKELDELIPNNWWRYNSHCWLENIRICRDRWCDNNTPYLSLEFGS